MNGVFNEFYKVIMEQSILGAILIWFMINNRQLVKQLLTIIENNTKALTEMRSSVAKCKKDEKE